MERMVFGSRPRLELDEFTLRIKGASRRVGNERSE
jgi:hypothetical protein